MRFRKLRIAAIVVVMVAVAACTYYRIGRNVYVKAAKSAFPNLPVNDCYYLPWPVGPKLIGQLAPDDPSYLQRDSGEKSSKGLHLIIYDSNGQFVIKTEE